MELSFFQSWDNVKALATVRRITLDAVLPKTNDIADEEALGRYAEKPIPRNQWDQFTDAERPDIYAKSEFADSYFSICVFSLRRVDSVTIAENQSFEQTRTVVHTSTLRESTTKTKRLEAVLGGELGATQNKGTPDATSGSGVSGSLRFNLSASYDVTNAKEALQENSNTSTQTQRYDAVSYDRDAVTWDLIKTIAIYRVYEGETTLVGLGDFLAGTTQLTYRKASAELEA